MPARNFPETGCQNFYFHLEDFLTRFFGLENNNDGGGGGVVAVVGVVVVVVGVVGGGGVGVGNGVGGVIGCGG